jgi:hypothetical protein
LFLAPGLVLAVPSKSHLLDISSVTLPLL